MQSELAEKEKIKKKRTLFQKIVNVFLYAGIGILILIFVALGFSQTSTFRNYLRRTVIEKADAALNGKINIGKIDGTIFTSLVLRNTSVYMGSDTLLNAGIISVNISPTRIFWKKILIRQFELKDAKIALQKNPNGELNISGLFPPSKPDTSHSVFPFKIEVADLHLANVDFSLQNYDKIKSSEKYDNLNMKDFRVNDINLDLSASADLKNHDIELKINNLSLKPNLNFFSLKNLSGRFTLNSKRISVEGLDIKTANSNLELDASADGLNIFDSTFSSSLKKAKLNVSLNVGKLDFNDLSSFVSSTDILKGAVAVKLIADGNFDDLTVKDLKVDYNDTHLRLKGNIRNLINPKIMNINVEFVNTQINEPDINKLLPKMGFPVFASLGTLKFDTLKFNGNPLNFKTSLTFKSSKGTVALSGKMDLTKPLFKYDIHLFTRSLNLSPFIGYGTSLNGIVKIKGEGVSTDQLNTNIKILFRNSHFNNNPVDTLRLDADAKNKQLNFTLKLKSLIANTDLKGQFDFSNKEKPTYDLNGLVENLNLADLSNDKSTQSDLNFNIDASGDHFNLDKLNLFLNLHLTKSDINGINIDSARTIVDIRSNDNGERIINLISDLADITLEGNFSLKQSIGFIARESNIVSSAFKTKINQILNSDTSLPSKQNINLSKTVKLQKTSEPFKPQKIKYLVEFKDFDLISLLLKNSHLQLNGNISGEINNNADSANISIITKFDYIKYWSERDVFFLSNLNLNLNLKNDLEDSTFSNINSSLHVTMDRLFVGSDFRNLYLDFKLNKNLAKIDMSAQMEDYLKTKLLGNIDFTDGTLRTDFKELNVSYNKYELKNSGDVVVDYSPENIRIENLKLVHNGGYISVNGNLSRNNQQDLKIQIKGMRGEDLSTNLLEVAADNSLGALINIGGEIKGNMQKPLINLTVDADSISFRKTNFGYLKSSFNYADQNLKIDLKFLDTTLYKKEPPLLLYGNVPINLSFASNQPRFPKSKPVNLTLAAKNFNLGALGNTLPMLNRLKGNLNTSLKIGGTIDNINPVGKVAITDADFFAAINNIEYTAGIIVDIKNQRIKIDSLLISNVKGVKGGGSISGGGYTDLKNFEFSSAHLELEGRLKVLSDASKAVSPGIYGDLIISTDKYIVFNSDGTRTKISAPIIVQEAKLTFPPPKSAFQNSADNYIYRFAADTSHADSSEMDFASLVKLSKEKNSTDSEEINEKPLALDYSVSVKIQNEAELQFILAKELNQNLTAYISGNFQYENIGGKSNAQGELKLLDGSTLQFLKTFDATGSIRFENELSNPYLNIVATYKNYYTPPDAEGKEEQVAVEIKLDGPLRDLSKNFSQNKDNIQVYVGADNITNNKPDPTKDVSDAVMFILTGKFPSDLTPQQQSQAVSQGSPVGQDAFKSTAMSVGGSLLGGFLNQYLGNYVRGVELRSVGSTTKFNLVGKVKDFRYSIGGSTDVFQDLSQANVKIEYPILKNFLLRVERKDAITQTTTSNDMINELGLKYRFEF